MLLALAFGAQEHAKACFWRLMGVLVLGGFTAYQLYPQHKHQSPHPPPSAHGPASPLQHGLGALGAVVAYLQHPPQDTTSSCCTPW